MPDRVTRRETLQRPHPHRGQRFQALPRCRPRTHHARRRQRRSQRLLAPADQRHRSVLVDDQGPAKVTTMRINPRTAAVERTLLSAAVWITSPWRTRVSALRILVIATISVF